MQDRYEPMPGIAELPLWIWRKLGRGIKLALGVFVLVALALAAVFAPTIRESKQERAAAERRERAQLTAQLVRELKAEQRPRFERSGAVAPRWATDEQRLAARAQVLEELSASILADARRRVRNDELDGPIRRAQCSAFPRTVDGKGVESDLSRRRGGYFCVAVTAEFQRSDASVGGTLGHPYRARVDFETGRYAYCKIAGRADIPRDQRVTTPRACAG